MQLGIRIRGATSSSPGSAMKSCWAWRWRLVLAVSHLVTPLARPCGRLEGCKDVPDLSDFPASSTYEAYLQRNIDMLADFRTGFLSSESDCDMVVMNCRPMRTARMRKANCSNATSAHTSKQLECSGHHAQAAAKEARLLDPTLLLLGLTRSHKDRPLQCLFRRFESLTMQAICAHLTPSAMPVDCSSYIATQQVLGKVFVMFWCPGMRQLPQLLHPGPWSPQNPC